MVCHELAAWQAVTGSRVVYSHHDRPDAGLDGDRMSPASRATSLSTRRRRPAAAARTPSVVYSATNPAKPRRAGPLSRPDLAERLRVFQRSLRSHVERRDALLDMVRAVNATLEPTKIAELVVERASNWVPAPCWALISADQSGQLSVLADRGLEADLGTAMYGVA